MAWVSAQCGVCFAALERIVGYGQFGPVGERHRGGEGSLCEVCLQKRNNGRIPPAVLAISANQPLFEGRTRHQATPDRCKSNKIGARGVAVCRILPK